MHSHTEMCLIWFRSICLSNVYSYLCQVLSLRLRFTLYVSISTSVGLPVVNQLFVSLSVSLSSLSLFTTSYLYYLRSFNSVFLSISVCLSLSYLCSRSISHSLTHFPRIFSSFCPLFPTPSPTSLPLPLFSLVYTS